MRTRNPSTAEKSSAASARWASSDRRNGVIERRREGRAERVADGFEDVCTIVLAIAAAHQGVVARRRPAIAAAVALPAHGAAFDIRKQEGYRAGRAPKPALPVRAGRHNGRVSR